jgi:hypothetical protein
MVKFGLGGQENKKNIVIAKQRHDFATCHEQGFYFDALLSNAH